MAFAEEHGWIPPVDQDSVYGFDEIPRLVADYAAGSAGYFPIYQVNP
jgi:hypothetical protein